MHRETADQARNSVSDTDLSQGVSSGFRDIHHEARSENGGLNEPRGPCAELAPLVVIARQRSRRHVTYFICHKLPGFLIVDLAISVLQLLAESLTAS